MFYDLDKEADRPKYKARCNYLYEHRKKVELTEKEPTRTDRQNNTAHLWFRVMAKEIGYADMEECKRDVKRAVLGMEEYMNKATGKVERRDFETHKMTVKQMADFMEKFKTWAMAEWHCYLPYFGDPGYDEMMNNG